MATNTSALKIFAQETRKKLISLIRTKMDYILTQDTAQLRGFESQIAKLKSEIAAKGKDLVVEEVAYTWFNRVMALRYMDANGYTDLKVVTPGIGMMRPEILQEAMSGNIDEDLRINVADNPKEAVLYRRLLVAVCNNYGTSMPFLFEHISDYTEMLLPDDLLSDQSFVTDIRNGMSDEDCQNVEVMGWLYQFYITDRKADAEVKKTKKGGLKSDEQAAATQLFTPHWVVRYMVENSLGRIWMTLHPDSPLIKDMPYYIPTPEGQTDVIPEDIHSAADIRFIDPCMGSGHILVYAFDLFCKMYEEEGVYQEKEIPQLILTNNLFGIDIDRRCYQLAAFALTMKARAYYRRYLRKTVTPNVIALQTIDRDTIESAGTWKNKSSMWQFENIDTIGSLLQITPEECANIKIESGLFGDRQQLLKTQAEYLSRKYHCVVTNPPYLGKGFGEALNVYANSVFPDSKSDLCTMFVERMRVFAYHNARYGFIIPPSWMFISSFEAFRKKIISGQTIDSVLHLSRGVFGADFGSSSAIICNHEQKNAKGVYFRLIERTFQEFDQEHLRQLFVKTLQNHDFRFLFSEYTKEITEIEYNDKGAKIYYPNIKQSNFEKIPGRPIGYWVNKKIINAFDSEKLEKSYQFKKGMSTGDNPRFIKFWTEVSLSNIIFNCTDANMSISRDEKWYPINSGGTFRKWYGNQLYVANWKHNGKEMKDNATILNHGGHWSRYITSTDKFYKEGCSWNAISSGDICVRYFGKGFLFCSASMCGYGNEIHHPIALLNSSVGKLMLKILAPTLNYGPTQIKKMPQIRNYNSEIIEELVSDNIAISRLDWDSHETSWDFKTNELIRLAKANQTIDEIVIEYKAVWTEKFMQLHSNEEELNRQFIEIYGLQDELTPDVPLNEVTILQKGEISIEDGEIVWHEDVIIKQLISYLIGCFMGRYSIDRPGLIIASQHQDLNALGLKVEGIDNGAKGRIAIDDDGIVPILEGEYFADDMTVRIEQAIKVLFGEERLQENLKYINEKLGKPLREYLFKDFFADHIDGKMYQKRPIYWLFSSKMGDKKKKGYFKALVYMHRIESDTLSKLHADYVSPYIDKIEQQRQEAEDNAVRDDISAAQRNKANKLAAELSNQLRELKEYAAILAQMSTQRISIDLDNGVRVNYPKFYPLVEPIKGLDKED